MKIGVLAVQGSFALHVRALRDVSVEPVEVRRSRHLEGLDGVILPGGESTTFQIVMAEDDLLEVLIGAIRGGLPTWGTCAGAIMLGRGEGIPQPRWGLIGVEVARNSYGRQVDSFVTPLEITGFDRPFDGVFIRAPRFRRIDPDVESLSRLEGEPVMARQEHLLVTAFHPELTSDRRVHRYFIEQLCQGVSSKRMKGDGSQSYPSSLRPAEERSLSIAAGGPLASLNHK